MKNIALCVLLCLGCFEQSARAQSTRAARKTMDQLISNYTVPFPQLKEQYTRSRFEGKKLLFPLQKIMLSNGAEAVYQTSDNAKVTKALSELFTKSPVDFLLAISGIEGRISIETKIIDWIKREDVPALVKLATVNIVTPLIRQGGKVIDFKVKPGDTLYYTKVPMGINALQLFTTYRDRIFPGASDITQAYEPVKAWCDSGKPLSDYKFTLLFPIMGLRSISYVPFKLYQYYPKKKAIDMPYALTSTFINNCTHVPKQAAGYHLKLDAAIADVKVNNFVKNYSY
jgi:hypothetical protein